MAGSSVTVTRTTQDIAGVREKEVVLDFACVSDDTTGLIPEQALTGLSKYIIKTARPIPQATPVTSAFEIRIEDENDKPLFLSGSIAVDNDDIIGGHAGCLSGDFPRLDSASAFKIVDPSDHTTILDVGNSKELIVRLELEKK
jgi:hypothetical protein